MDSDHRSAGANQLSCGAGIAGPDPIERFTSQCFVPQGQNTAFACPIRSIAIAESLDGAELALVRALQPNGMPAVVSDENTYEALGRRVERALGAATSVVLERPDADEATADQLLERSRGADALIAVGSGTLNDLCKYVAHRTGRPSMVFATAPSMNGYVTSTASISRNGYKHSLPAIAPQGVFLDLEVLAAAPVRMIHAGLGDVLCRSTAQVDWLLSHLLLHTPYAEDPFAIQAADERIMLERTGGLAKGDPEAILALVRLLVLSGLGMLLVGSSHPGSMGEHGISHYIDMLLHPHPGSLHGEQVGVASLTMVRVQAEILSRQEPPWLVPQALDQKAMRRRYGPLAQDCLAVMCAKGLNTERARALNVHLQSHWPELRRRLQGIAVAPGRLERALREAGAATRPEDLGIAPGFYREAVLHAREIRERYGMLDLAADAGLLGALVERLDR
jgi:glycerol-1-phosphate dehydrogenase [NAD(P)+]